MTGQKRPTGETDARLTRGHGWMGDITEAEVAAFNAGGAGKPLPADAGIMEQAAWARGRDGRDEEERVRSGLYATGRGARA